jgi:hypothetical protein
LFDIGRVLLPVAPLIADVLGAPLLIAVPAYQAILGIAAVLSAVILSPPAPSAFRF